MTPPVTRRSHSRPPQTVYHLLDNASPHPDFSGMGGPGGWSTQNISFEPQPLRFVLREVERRGSEQSGGRSQRVSRVSLAAIGCGYSRGAAA